MTTQPNQTPEGDKQEGLRSEERFKSLKPVYFNGNYSYDELLFIYWCKQDAHYLPILASKDKEIEALKETIESVEHEVSKVYCHITNGKISKINTLAEVVIAVSDDDTTALVDKEIEAKDACIREHVFCQDRNLHDLIEAQKEIERLKEMVGVMQQGVIRYLKACSPHVAESWVDHLMEIGSIDYHPPYDFKPKLPPHRDEENKV